MKKKIKDKISKEKSMDIRLELQDQLDNIRNKNKIYEKRRKRLSLK